MDKPKSKCRYCGTELSQSDKGNYLICLKCHPPSKPSHRRSKKKEDPKYVDVKLTEKRVREIVRDELENWHIQKPPLSRSEIGARIKADTMSTEEYKELVDGVPETTSLESQPTYRQRAKELGIKTFGRKKVDVLKDIEARTDSSFNK